MKNSLVVFTASNDYRNSLLAESCYKMELPLYSSWLPDTMPWKHWHKQRCQYEFLSLLDPSCPVLFSDATDSAVIQPAKAILDKWDGQPMFAAERFCWPDHIEDRYPAKPTPYRFLCSGGWIAKAGDIVEILDSAPWDQTSDQRFYTKAFLDRPFLKFTRGIRLDYDCQIFQSTNGCYDELVYPETGPILNKVTGSEPAVIHMNGADKAERLIPLKEYVWRLAWPVDRPCRIYREGL